MSRAQTGLFAGGLVVIGLSVIFATHSDYGISWDEPAQSEFGERLVRYFATCGADQSANDFHHMRYYGPLFELVTALLHTTKPEAKYEIRHFAIASTGLLALIGLLPIARRIGEPWSVVFASLALIAMPRFYGHAFINSKDIPFACAFVWSMSAMISLTLDGSRRRSILTGLAFGATLAIRPGGLPLLLAIYVCLTAYGTWSRKADERPTMRRLALSGLWVWAIAWLGMVALWPWAHASPIAHPVEAIRAALFFPDTFPVLFGGRITMSDALPRSYLPTYLAITTPVLTLLLAGVGVAASIRAQLRGAAKSEAIVATALQLWLFVPIGAIAIVGANVYDGIRHVLFTLPALALFAAWGAAALVQALRKPLWRNFARVALALALASPVLDLVRLHPYQMTYFNAFVGGVEGATGRYDTDYWLTSYREAMEWVNAQRDESDRTLTVLVAVDDYAYECAARFAGPGVLIEQLDETETETRLADSYDYFIATTRWNMHGYYRDSPVVHRIGRDGGVFTIIRGH